MGIITTSKTFVEIIKEILKDLKLIFKEVIESNSKDEETIRQLVQKCDAVLVSPRRKNVAMKYANEHTKVIEFVFTPDRTSINNLKVMLLEVKKLRAGYGEIPILHDISFQVEQGEIIAVVGSNGAGKTTLMKTISGLIEPISGEIIFNGEPIQKLPPHQIVAKGVAQVPEGRQLFNFLTVEQNLMIGSNISAARARRQESLELVFGLFPVLAERKKQKAGTLSGGEQQMLATARGLMARPLLLMMDEASWGLAPILTTELFEAIKRVNEQTGTTILLVEQNVYKALSIATHAYVLERGNIIMKGTGQELLGSEELKVAYLGL